MSAGGAAVYRIRWLVIAICLLAAAWRALPAYCVPPRCAAILFADYAAATLITVVAAAVALGYYYDCRCFGHRKPGQPTLIVVGGIIMLL